MSENDQSKLPRALASRLDRSAFSVGTLADQDARSTGDPDIWVAMHPDTATRLVDALAKFGFAGAGAIMDGVSVGVIGREDLIANKLAAGRDKDLNDLKHLGRTKAS